MSNLEIFRALVKYKMVLRGWKGKDLAKATGYTVGTIYAFMHGSRTGKELVNAIAKALELKPPGI